MLTFDPVKGRQLYVNGVATGDVDARAGGSLADWDDAFALVLGNETSNNRQWAGVISSRRSTTARSRCRRSSRTLPPAWASVTSCSSRVGAGRLPKSYIMLEGQQYDSWAYLFQKPTFINLDGATPSGSLPLKGMRIGVNGAETSVGQAYATLDTTIGGSAYSATSGQVLSPVGTVIALEKGPADDSFFLTFEQIGANAHAHTDPTPVIIPPVVNANQPDIGVRTFDQLNLSMASITGVAPTTPAVAQTFQTLKQQLPTVPSIEAFLASPRRRGAAGHSVLLGHGRRRRQARRVLPGAERVRVRGHVFRPRHGRQPGGAG